jgi:formylglycine-generating enzyme required for sulfatase activity
MRLAIALATAAFVSFWSSLTIAQTPKPGHLIKDCIKCPEMVVVPPGEFMMGSPNDEQGRDSDEGPLHRVTFAKSFAVGRFSVTFDEWDACVADGGCNGYRPSDSESALQDEGWGRGLRPVINVSWDDAKAYVAWLSRKTGQAYRLLSEAEREYVTRAGTRTPYWWGSSISESQANYGIIGRHSTPRKTVPVDSFQPNPWGLYQVHGDVLEWVEDCYHDSYAGAPSTGLAWVSGDCSRRVDRGGSWFPNRPWEFRLRSAARGWAFKSDRGGVLGFRVGRTLTP